MTWSSRAKGWGQQRGSKRQRLYQNLCHKKKAFSFLDALLLVGKLPSSLSFRFLVSGLGLAMLTCEDAVQGKINT